MRRVPPLLVVSWLLFLALGIWTSGRTPAHHEEISTSPTRPARVLVMAEEGVLEQEPSCADENPPTTVASQGRPMLAVCAGGLTLPVLIASYASGIPHWHSLLGWPLHDGTVFGLRRWTLLVGLLSLFLVHRLVTRLRDELTAGITTLVLAVAPAFILLHANLLQYEVMPWLFIMLAGLVALGPEGTTKPQRPVLVGVFVGLAMASNVKATFLLTVIVFLAWWMRALRQVRWADLGKATAGFVLGFAPLWVPNVMFGGAGLDKQVSNRTMFFSREATLSDVGLESINVVRFATDTASYMNPQWEPLGFVGTATAVLVGLTLLFTLVQAVRVLISHEGDAIEATTGLLLVVFLVISIKLYNKSQGANYAPMHAFFAMAVATAITRVTRWRGGRRLALGLAAVFVVGLGHSTYVRVAATDDLPMSINAQAEARLVAHLTEHPDPQATIYTTIYNLAGVIDSLGRGELSTVRLERVFNTCSNNDMECVETRFGWLIDHPGALPARVVLPVETYYHDENNASLYEEALAGAAARAGVTMTVEGDFAAGVGDGGPPMIRLVRLDRT